MANIIKTGEKPAVATLGEIQIDNVNELEGLKNLFAPGSFAYLADLSRIWHLNNNHEWVEIE